MTIQMAFGQCERPARMDRALAVAFFPIAVVILRCMPLRGTLAVARVAKRPARRLATLTEAESARSASVRAARWFPGRAACLECSFATFLLCAVRGRSVDWCLGCRFRPVEAHAWVEASGRPVGEFVATESRLHVTVRI